MARARRVGKRRGFRLWWLGAGLGGLVLLAVAVAAAAYLYLRTSLPTIDGDVQIAGLEAPVDVVRDQHAIPHIFAKSPRDAYFAMGFVHAQDRLWQMEFQRRLATGRLSEVIGARTLEIDKFIRTLGIPQASAAAAKNLSPESRAVFEAYAAGVNAFLAQRGGALPLEFILLGAEPEPWRVEDTIGWTKMMAWDLSGNAFEEALRARMAAFLTTEQLAVLWPEYPASAATPERDALRQLAPLFRSLAEVFPARPVPGLGSNNWVVNGDHSASGKPLLANDPHLRLSTPSLWYLAHLSAPGLEVIGGTLPGIPTPVLGRTDRIAWGFTNTGPDVQDLYLERIDPQNPKNYLTPDGSEPFVERTEVIKVKGEPDVTVTVRETRHGPVVTDLLEKSEGFVGKDQVVAFAWTALAPDDRTSEAGVKLVQASDWETFLVAARDFLAPQQNIVYADRDGHIGYIAPGRVPIRKSDIGWLPSDGTTDDGDWIDVIPFDDLPQRFDPPEGRIVTANNRVVDDSYRYFIALDFSPPYRADRINQRLGAIAKHDVDSFASIQRDVYSQGVVNLLPMLLGAVKTTSPQAQAMIDRLKSFDGEMVADKAEPLVVIAWLRELMRGLFADELKDTFEDYWSIRLEPIAAALSTEQAFCDDVSTEPKEDCAGIVSAALDRALADIERRFGNDPEAWRWGDAHAVKAANRVLGQVPLIGPLFDITMPHGGEKDTVNAGGFEVGNEDDPFGQIHGAGYRAVYDLAEPDKSVFIQSSGQSGNPFSPHYKSFAELWGAGAHVPMITDRAKLEPGAIGTLRLSPP